MRLVNETVSQTFVFDTDGVLRFARTSEPHDLSSGHGWRASLSARSETRYLRKSHLARDGTSSLHDWHSLIDYSTGESAVFDSILRRLIVGARLAVMAGGNSLPEILA